ncbi:MAG: hypothetical protein PHU56_03150 [Candidatus Pacebacteria bacterium]|nr:hypothetical protein [Candidatus Paceibacterota bacterium]
MILSQFYVLISVVVLAVIMAVMLAMGKGKYREISPLGGIAFAFVMAGIILPEKRMIGYGLMGIGAILVLIDTVMILRKKIKNNKDV